MWGSAMKKIPPTFFLFSKIPMKYFSNKNAIAERRVGGGWDGCWW
jgi:hypothetical protein